MNKNICVFCGSRPGSNDQWSTWAKDLGQGIATRNWTLVFGGGGNGLMGQIAQGALHQHHRADGQPLKRERQREPTRRSFAERIAL